MSGAWRSLVVQDKIGEVVRFFTDVVRASFESHPMRSPTRAEVRRRSELAMTIFGVLRGDLKWSLERIYDTLPQYLGCALDGRAWEPHARSSMWASERAGPPRIIRPPADPSEELDAKNWDLSEDAEGRTDA